MVNSNAFFPEDIRKGQEKIKEEISISKAIVSLHLVSCGY